MTFMQVYQIVIPIITIGALIYTSVEDVLYREVRKNIIWIILVVVGLIFDALYIIFSTNKTEAVLEILINIVVGFILGFILFYGGIWGGADTKALWSLSILAPVHPLINGAVFTSTNYIPVISSMVFSLLINAGVLTVFYPIALVIINSFSASKNSLFNEVRGTTSQKIRCFLFGYKKKIENINAKKLHYLFLEDLPPIKFEGSFKGDFSGRLEGKFIGFFSGTTLGEFVGRAKGIIKKGAANTYNQLSFEEIIKIAEHYQKKEQSEETLNEEMFPLLKKYRLDFLIDNEPENTENVVMVNGSLNIPLQGLFLGILEGVFEGDIDGEFIGKLEGHYKGTSKKGKISGTQQPPIGIDWNLHITMRLEEEEEMEQKQLHTLWLLRDSNKKTVWVMPGIPFILLLLIGYILYLLIGNIALLLFSI